MAIFTKTLTNSSLTITTDMGLKIVTIYCTAASTASATILGTKVLSGAIASDTTYIVAGQSLTVGKYEVTEDVACVITAPSGCTLYIIGI